MALSKKTKRVLLTIAFVIFNVVVIVATAVNEFGNSKTAAELSEVQINWWLLIPAAICFAVMIFLEYLKYAVMLKRLTKPGTFSKCEALKLGERTVMIGRYYDRITPASVGGQPFQIYNLTKSGKVSHGLAAAIPIFSMISGQITFILIAIPCFLLGGIAQTRPALFVTAQIGLIFYAFWPVLVAAAAFFPKPTTRFIKFLTKILAKLRIVKNRDKALDTIEREVGDYVKCIKTIFKKQGVFWSILIMSLVSNVLITFVPYFVLTAFGGDVGFVECFVLTMAVQSAIYFIPTPGNSGVAEGTFYVVFSALSTGYVFWAMMVWRFFSFYVYIIAGPLIYLKMHLENRRKQSDRRTPC